MLQEMREQARGIFGKIVVLAIVLVLSVFGFGALTFFEASEPVVVEVGDTEITEARYLGLVDQQRRTQLAQLGPDGDPAQIDEEALRASVLDGLIARTLLLEGARRAGMGAPEAALDEIILDTPEFQLAGEFDQQTFRGLLALRGFTPLSYREALGEDLLVNQLASAIGDSAFVTDAEVVAMAELSRQERDVAWLPFAPADYAEEIVVDEADLLDFYDRNSDRYLAPELVTVEYLQLDLDTFASAEEVTEEDVLAAYEAEVEAFEGQERRRSSHVLLAVDDDRDEAAAIALAAELRERVLAGEDFGELAGEYSDDPGSASRGGDLGFAIRGTFVPAFEQALFGLQEYGELSEPVVSQFGVHLIRLDEITRTEPPALEARRSSLEQRIRTRAARERYDEARLRLETLAYEAPDLAEPAAELSVEIATAGPFGRDGGEGDFAVPAVIEAAFSDEVLDGGYNSDLLDPRDDVTLVLRVVEHTPERLRELEEVSEQVRADLVVERAREQAAVDAQEALARLEAGASVSGIAAEFSREWTVVDGMTRADFDVPQPVIERAFSVPHPADGERSLGSAELPEGGVAVVAVTAVRSVDPEEITDVERLQLERLIQFRLGGAEFTSFRAALRRDLGVTQRATDASES